MSHSAVKNSSDDEDSKPADNKKYFYYPTHNSIENAQLFNQDISLNDTDIFVQKLRVALKKFPSISKISNIKVKKSDRPFKSQVSAHTTEPKGSISQRSTKVGPKIENISNISLESQFEPQKGHPKAEKSKPKIKLNKDKKDNFMTDCVRSQYIDLVQQLCHSEDNSFPDLFLCHKQEFFELLSQINIIKEVIPKTIEVILKVFSMVHSSEHNMLYSLFRVEFIEKIISYITLLPTECEVIFAEDEVERFFENVLLFCENVNKKISLQTAEVLKKILLSMQFAMKGLKEVKNFNFSETLKGNISKLLENLRSKREKETKKGKHEAGMEPPDSVKDIVIYPNKKDLFEPASFLRKNVVDGSYRDVNHYIDVQFRLLREDFVAPLRNGLQLYRESIAGNQNQNRVFDNIRVHDNVKILHGTITDGRLGHLVHLQKEFGLSRDSKRFMFGSLVLFTADNFESFFCGTVINTAGHNLLIVDLCGDQLPESDTLYNKVFTMIESEVYFGPYLHVLTALQQLNCDTFPMKEYIVDVKPNKSSLKAEILNDCPSFLNKSQKEAFTSAMNDEFVVIQGPPGTGKTFLAEAITKTLLLNKGQIYRNSKVLYGVLDHEYDDFGDYNDFDDYENERFWDLKRRIRTKRDEDCVYYYYNKEWMVFHSFFCEEERNDKPILVICYTNHALDQFLERLIMLTKRVIRVGGQSKNRVVQEFNLKEIRRCFLKEHIWNRKRCNCDTCKYSVGQYQLYFKHFTKVESIIYKYLVCLKILKAIVFDGVLKMCFLRCWVSPMIGKAILQEEQYEAWLLEGAKVFHIEDKGENHDHKPDLFFHTRQLLNEILESKKFSKESEVFNARTVEQRSTTEADDKFFLTFSKLTNQRENIQKKLRKSRQMGEKENVINMYETQIEDLEKKRNYILYMLAHKPPIDLKRIRELNSTSNIWTIDFEDRWMLYNYWVQQYENKIKREMFYIEMDLRKEEERFTREKDEVDLKLLKSANVIGMTTTSGARLRNVLEEIGPEIVIVEEAAEVLESHIVVALHPSVKKVILIGDHKQLRPSLAVYELAQKYKLDVSLFERMINNGLACQVLDTQQRMRPEIASLIVPGIYPDLKNGEKVLDRPDIRGVACNVFFVTHNKFEDESFGENRSHSNSHEVDFLISFCQYLLKQDYEHSEITILTTYLGQMKELENESRRKHLPPKLRITTVDNYQGEECDIILLSLVRSNKEARIGFLSAENRVCVALSRARNGLYIIGNMDNLTQSSSVWRQVKAQLEAMDAIGPALPLGCRNHQSEKSAAACSNDFKRVPISGCNLKCGTALQCGHICTEFCHSYDREHKGKFACSLPCERMSCEEHRCPRLCGEECGECRVLVERQLTCGHSVQLRCSQNPKHYSCIVEMTLTLEYCGHTVTRPCYNPYVSCMEPCSGTMDCGHPCEEFCHASRILVSTCDQGVKDQPTEDGKKSDSEQLIPGQLDVSNVAILESKRINSQTIERDHSHEKKFCHVQIEKTLDCGHIKEIFCCDSKKNIVCQEPCPKTLPCEHPCFKLCGEACSQRCDTLVEKTLTPCGHQLMLACSVPGSSSQCRQPCPLNLPCGHPCPGTCSAECSGFTCHEEVRCSVEPGCGHGLIYIPCHVNMTDLQANNDQLLQHCRAPCRADLPCGHMCVGRCGDCLQGRLHIPCSNPCSRTLKCGHRCEEDCSSECPRFCVRPCTNRCPHRACDQQCGDPCTPCQEPCARSCEHGQCSRPCGEDCDCPPCDQPCPSTLRCGHPCPGFCGEPCIKYCVVCYPDAFVVPGYFISNPEDKRYVLLEDCGDPIEENLLKKLIVANRKPNEVLKCPICGDQVRFILRYKDHINKFYTILTEAKKEENIKVANFESKMKTEKYNLKHYSDSYIEPYGDEAFFILEHLKKAHPVYKTSLWVFTFFKQLTKYDRYKLTEDQSWAGVIERRKCLLRALSLRLASMSVSDYNQLLTEIVRLELASSNWPARSHLLHSIKKYSLEELKALK